MIKMPLSIFARLCGRLLEMQHVAVISSVIRSVGYDASTSKLEVEFHNGSVYEYRSVPQEVYEALMVAISKGQYFDARIRSSYKLPPST